MHYFAVLTVRMNQSGEMRSAEISVRAGQMTTDQVYSDLWDRLVGDAESAATVYFAVMPDVIGQTA
jgi:hypothetical protein